MGAPGIEFGERLIHKSRLGATFPRSCRAFWWMPRPISLSATAFHSALGQIRDKLAGSEALRELTVALLRELAVR